MPPPNFPGQEPPARLPLARPITRLGATLVDNLVLIPIAAIVVSRSGLSTSSGSVPVTVYNSAAYIILACELVYQWILVGWLGQTLGDMAVGIKVERADGGGVPGFLRAAVRIGTIAVLSQIPVAGPFLVLLCYLWLLWDPLRQGLHDKAARTVVVDLRPRRYAPGR